MYPFQTKDERMSINVKELLPLFQEHFLDCSISLEADTLCVSTEEGFDLFLVAGQEQILVETVLFPTSALTDIASASVQMLQANPILPLSSFAIRTYNNQDYVVIFGALSINSKTEVIVEEVEVLRSNIGDAFEMFSNLLN